MFSLSRTCHASISKCGHANSKMHLETVLVRNVADAMCCNTGTDDGEDEVCYVMQRAAGNYSRSTHLFSSDVPQAAEHS